MYEIRNAVRRIVALMEVLVFRQCKHRLPCRVVAVPKNVPDNHDLNIALSDSDLITIKEAAAHLNVSRYTVDAMRKRGELTSIRRNNRVRLNWHEVKEARKWYSVRKGKV